MRQKAQSFNNGVAKIYAVGNTAPPGAMPKEGLTLKNTLRYHERTVGLTRYFTALQANVQVAALIRCPLLRSVSAQDIAVINDGKQYRIALVQYPEGADPPVMDLTLERMEQNYAVP